MAAGAFFMLMSCLWAFISGVVCVWETQRVVIAKEEEKGEGWGCASVIFVTTIRFA
jgi:hypothetical protein